MMVTVEQDTCSCSECYTGRHTGPHSCQPWMW